MRKSLLVLFTLLTVLISSMAFATPTRAQDVPANEAAEDCRRFDAAGNLDRLGLTRGECVNVVKGPSNENANNDNAAQCGVERIQKSRGTTNKGQCIQVLRDED